MGINVFDQKKTLICPQFSFTNYRMKYYTFLESAYLDLQNSVMNRVTGFNYSYSFKKKIEISQFLEV